jgi:chromosome segregation ATPase
MSTNKHRVLPVSEDLEDTVELPSLPSISTASTDSWVAPQIAADAATEEFPRPSLPELVASVEQARVIADEHARALATEHAAALVRVAELERDLATRVEQHRLGEAERDGLRQRLERLQTELHNAGQLREHQAAMHAEKQREWEAERAQGDGVMLRAQGELTEMRRRTAAQAESLQHLEGRRQLFDSMLREREAMLDARDTRLQGLGAELAAIQSQVERAHGETAAARAETAAARRETEAARAETAAVRREADTIRAEAEVARLATAAAGGEAEAARAATAAAQRETAAARLASEAARHESEAARAAAVAARLEADGARAEATAAQAQVAAQQARADELARSLERAQQDTAAVQQQHSATLGDVAGLEHDLADHDEALRVLHEQLRAAQLTIESLRADVAAAEDLLRTQECEHQQRATRVARLESNEAALRARLESAERHAWELAGRHDKESVARHAGHTPPPPPAAGGDAGAATGGGTPVALDAHARLLVRTEGDAGIVHLLRRKTSIGRTPDNDLCIEADFVSRHHAVVLVSAAGTILEDLNSTNGVYVNGLRVSRHKLMAGDLVTIGKTDFRYVIKPPAEPVAG